MYDKYFQIRRQTEKQRMQLGGEKKGPGNSGLAALTDGRTGYAVYARVYVYGFTVTEKFVLVLAYLWEQLRLTDG